MSDVQIKHVGHVWAGQLRQVKFAKIDHGTGADGTTSTNLVTAVAGKKIRVLRAFIQAAGTTPTVVFYSGATSATNTTALSGIIPLSATAGTALDVSSEHGLFETAAGQYLVVDCTGNANNVLDGFLVYVEV